MSSKTFVVNFRLPAALHTSNSAFCKVVHVSYQLRILILDSKIKFPITVGLVPLYFEETISGIPEQVFDFRPTDFAPSYPMSFTASAPLDIESRKLCRSSKKFRNYQIFFIKAPPTFDEAVKMPDFTNHKRF